MKRIACIYHFYEKDIEHVENLKFFLKHGISPEVQYLFFMASTPDFEFPTAPNIFVFSIPNAGFDFGGYQIGAQLLHQKGEWDYVFFMNSGVVGPFVPSYVSKPWYELFIDKLTDDVKIVGTTINSLPQILTVFPQARAEIEASPFFNEFNLEFTAHVQSMFFCLTKEALEYLRLKGLFDQKVPDSKRQAVVNFELAMSQLILRRGWNIGSILSEYGNFDFRTIDHDPNFSGVPDPYFHGSFFGKTINPWDVIFYKTSRKLLSPEQLNDLRQNR